MVVAVLADRSRAPALAIAASALIWGAWWLPLRALESRGLSGSWATVAVYAVAFAGLVPILLARAGSLRPAAGGLVLIALVAGASLAAWNHALLTGEVVRSMLLFFVSPVWATLLAWIVLRQPMRRLRLVTVPLGLAGAAIVLGADVAVPWPHDEAEAAALIAGMLFAVASVVIRATERIGDVPKTAATFLGCAVGAGVAALLLPVGAAPRVAGLVGVLPLVAAIAFVVLLPATWLEIWGNSRLDPGAVNVIFQLEIVVAAVTAGLLAGEPLGWREIAGGALIIGAGLIETFDRPSTAHR